MGKPVIRRMLGLALLASALAACSPIGGAAATSAPAPATNLPALATTAATNVPMPATPAPAGSPGIPPAQPGPSADADAAVQVVIDYYAALDQKQYNVAYQLWANQGQASGQSLEQFQAGFAQTAATQLRLGAAQTEGGAVRVPVELVAIDNDGQSQRVAQYRGSYTLTRATGAWQLSAAALEPATGALPPADRSEPAQALQQYYNAISSHELARAYTFWGSNGRNSLQRYVDFARGFAATAQVQLVLGRATGDAAAGSLYSAIPALITATQVDGSQQTFCGTYILRRLNVPPFDQLGWQIERAEVAPHAAVADEATAQQVLAGGCK